MKKLILNTVNQKFINNNLNSDISSLLLKGISFDGVTTREIIEQIEAKKKCENKLPTWFSTEKIYYPSKLNIEQTSSEITAHYKSQLISGKSIIDLTGGFGVDCYYFSKYFNNVIHCEINEELSKIVNHNFIQLNKNNISTRNVDGIECLSTTSKGFDWIYADPSRRHNTKGKVFFLKDCLPNIPEHLESLFKNTNNILIKTSPLLDISIGVKELKCVKTIHIVALNNDVKELLWILEEGFNDSISVKTVNIKKENKEYFNFNLEDETKAEVKYSLPLTYLYEPNSAILKAGGFNTVSKQFSLHKLHKHSHLYTNDILIDFPGRSFKIEKVIPFNNKALKNANIAKANIATRNFSVTVQQIRKKFFIKDGGDYYLFFTTDINSERIVVITSKVNKN